MSEKLLVQVMGFNALQTRTQCQVKHLVILKHLAVQKKIIFHGYNSVIN